MHSCSALLKLKRCNSSLRKHDKVQRREGSHCAAIHLAVRRIITEGGRSHRVLVNAVAIVTSSYSEQSEQRIREVAEVSMPIVHAVTRHGVGAAQLPKHFHPRTGEYEVNKEQQRTHVKHLRQRL